jgi:hypothetical protein
MKNTSPTIRFTARKLGHFFSRGDWHIELHDDQITFEYSSKSKEKYSITREKAKSRLQFVHKIMGYTLIAKPTLLTQDRFVVDEENIKKIKEWLPGKAEMDPEDFMKVSGGLLLLQSIILLIKAQPFSFNFFWSIFLGAVGLGSILKKEPVFLAIQALIFLLVGLFNLFLGDGFWKVIAILQFFWCFSMYASYKKYEKLKVT